MTYQIRFFDGQDLLSKIQPLDSATDDDALEHLARIRHPHALELWQGERLVWRFSARNSP